MKPTPRILALQKQFYNQYKANKRSWVKKYEHNTEQAMTGAAFNRAKSAAMKEQKQRIREMVRKALMGPENPVDTATLDIPLLIRLLEYAKEDAQTDMDLHKVAENIIALSKEGKTLTMSDYNRIVSISND